MTMREYPLGRMSGSWNTKSLLSQLPDGEDVDDMEHHNDEEEDHDIIEDTLDHDDNDNDSQHQEDELPPRERNPQDITCIV